MPDDLEEMEGELENIVESLDSDSVSLGEKHEEVENILEEIQGQLEFLKEQVDYNKK